MAKHKKDESGLNVIERLQEILDMANNGEINNVIIIASTNDDSMLRCWANDNDKFSMVGELESTKIDFILGNIQMHD